MGFRSDRMTWGGIARVRTLVYVGGMAGRPMLRALAERIEEKGGEEWVFSQLADAVTTGKVAEMLDCSRALLYDWRNQGGEERIEGWEEALRRAGMAYAENAVTQLDTAAEDREVTGGRARLLAEAAKQKQWMATKLDRERFGDDKQGASVVVNLPNMHVGALRSVERPSIEEGRVVEAELVEDGEDGSEDVVGVLRSA